jgi:hypothetical protein
MRAGLLLIALLTHPGPALLAAEPAAPSPLDASVAQLRHAAGEWNVTTEFLNDDGSVGRSTSGTYRFDWVIPGRVLSGRSDIPEIQMTSALLFYVNDKTGVIEMVSVGADGALWIMTGPLGGETRETRPFKTADGGESRLRFTRYNVQPDSFESKMEYTADDGKTWLPGNHQRFVRNV